MTLYWVGGAGNWSDTAHWATSSGGGGGNGPPTSTDDVVFDSLSGGGTATLDVDGACKSMASAGSTTAFNLGSRTLTMHGNLNFAGFPTWTYGASTVVFAANGSITGPATTILVDRFFNIIVNDGVAVTLTANYSANMDGTLTLLGTAALTGNARVTIDALSIAATASPDFHLHFQGGNLPGGTYRSVQCNGSTHNIQGNITTTGNSTDIAAYSFFGNNSATVNTNGYTLNVQGSAGFALITSAILNAGASLINVKAFDTSLGTFNFGTSTIVFVAASTTIKLAQPGTNAGNVYNVTVNQGVTLTMTNDIESKNGLVTVNGTLTSGGAPRLEMFLSTTSDHLVVGPSGSVSAITIIFWQDGNASFTTTVPGTIYANLYLINWGAATTNTATFNAGGAITTTGFLSIGPGGNTTPGLILDTTSNNYGLTVGTALTVGANGVTGILIANGSTVTIGNDIAIGGTGAFGLNSYISLGSSSWTVAGDWTNASTSASWDAGVSTVTFNDTNVQTIGGSGTKNIFNILRFSGSGRKDITANLTSFNIIALSNVTVRVTASTVLWTFNGTSISANSGFTLTLESSAVPTKWRFKATGDPVATRVSVSYSDASEGITVDASDGTCTDGGNTINWLFQPVITISSLTVSPASVEYGDIFSVRATFTKPPAHAFVEIGRTSKRIALNDRTGIVYFMGKEVGVGVYTISAFAMKDASGDTDP